MVTLTHSVQQITTALQTAETENDDFILVMGATRWRSWLRQYATSQKVAGPSPDEVNILNLPSPCSSTMTLGSTPPLTGTSTRNLPWRRGKGRPARKADSLTAICEPIV
jgi:hypothetical protein